MRYEDSVVELKKQLLSLGFADGLELALRSKICFQPDRFVLRYRLVKDADVVDFVLQFELAADTAYGCSFYEAVLRKRIPVERNDLDVAMQGINWKSVDDFSRIDAIVSGLKQLEVSDEGVLLSSLLKFKHWSGTAVEDLIPNLAAHRSKYEVNQRFYFFDGEGQITVEEAYRFLCNRWMEKQLQLRKKQEVPVVPAEAGSASPDNGLMKKVSLLPKKKRGQGSRMK